MPQSNDKNPKYQQLIQKRKVTTQKPTKLAVQNDYGPTSGVRLQEKKEEI